MTKQGTVSLSRRAFSDEAMDKLKTICDEHMFGQGVFCSIIVADVILDEELAKKYIAKAQQFEDDQAPATIAEMKTLRETLRQQEEELEALREFKRAAQGSLNSTAVH